MTEATNDWKIPDYLELVDSSDNSTILTPKDKSLENAKQQNIPMSLLPVSISRPLPVENGVLGQKLPYDNVRNGSGDSDMVSSLSVNIREAGKRPSYGAVPYIQTSPEMNSYCQLSSVLDDYDILAPVENRPVPSMDKTQSQHNANSASKKCVAISVCCTLVALLVVLAATLTAVLVTKDTIEKRMDKELSSLRKLQMDMNTNVLDSMLTIFGSRENVANLTVIYDDSCYCLYLRQLGWKDAKDFCLAKGNSVHLAEIYKREENDFLMRLLQSTGFNKAIWLGGSDLDKEGTWLWNYTGKPVEQFDPTQWLPNQPSSFSPLSTKEDCLNVYNWDSPTFKWNDNGCEEWLPFLCQSRLLQSQCFCDHHKTRGCYFIDTEKKITNRQVCFIDVEQKIINRQVCFIDMEQKITDRQVCFIDMEQKITNRQVCFIDMEQKITNRQVCYIDMEQKITNKHICFFDMEQKITNRLVCFIHMKQKDL